MKGYFNPYEDWESLTCLQSINCLLALCNLLSRVYKHTKAGNSIDHTSPILLWGLAHKSLHRIYEIIFSSDSKFFSTLICTLQILNFFFSYFYFSNLLWYKFHLSCGWKSSKEMILVGRLQTKKPSVKKNLIAFEIHLSRLLLLIRSRCILSQIIRRHQD